MQEQRSGLWYLRTTAELAANGLYAALQGFQTQVFVNIHEVDDNEWGHYRTLYETLNGRGIADVHMGIQNIFLKDLYSSLAALASPEYFNRICDPFKTASALAVPMLEETKDLASGKASRDKASMKGSSKKTVSVDKKKTAAFIADLEKPARDFFVTCNTFIDGNYGAQTIPEIAKPKDRPGDRDLWKSFSGNLEKLFAIASCEKEGSSAFTKESSVLLKTVLAGFSADQTMDKTAGAFLILLAVNDLAGTTDGAGRKLIDQWNLDRKIADLLTDYGMDGSTVLYQLQTLIEMIALITPKKKDTAKTGKTAGNKDAVSAETAPEAVQATRSPAKLSAVPSSTQTGSSLPAAILGSEHIRAIAGTHEWDGICWFNKEKAEWLIDLLITGLVLAGVPETQDAKKKTPQKAFSLSAWDNELSAIAVLRKQSYTILDDSGYRLDTIIGDPVLQELNKTGEPVEKEKKPAGEASRKADSETKGKSGNRKKN